MTNREIKLNAQRFIKEFDIRTVSYEALQDAAEKQGYTVVEFNHLLNDGPEATLIRALKLSEQIRCSRGFTYADSHRRIVFVDESLSDDEKMILIAHELGHIRCGHMSSASIIGKDVREEFEANEFAHYLFMPSPRTRARSFVLAHKIPFIIGISAFALLLAGTMVFVSVFTKNRYYGDYYVTETGYKYHDASCKYIEDRTNKHRLTKEEYASGQYEPCGVCLIGVETKETQKDQP